MNEYELNEDQIRRIEARLNILHMEMMEMYNCDRESYQFAAGCSNGICRMLDELGYHSVYDAKSDRCYVRRRPDGLQ